MVLRPKLKVRTGCTTCKLRKVKCDEGKPFCNRCKVSGRKCDGYASINPKATPSLISEQSTVIVHSKPRGQTRNPPPRLVADIDPLLSLPVELEDSKWLHFFSSRTGPALTPFSDDHAFWSEHVPLLGLAEPAIRHALLAVASFHERFEKMHSATGASRVAGYSNFTVKHYSLAISELQQAINADKSGGLEVPLVCCLLFILLECLYGNHPLVLTHLRNGLNILKLPEFHLTGDGEKFFVRKKLEQIFTKLQAHSTLFGAPAINSASPTLDNAKSITRTHDIPFADAIDARSCLDIIISSTLHFVKSLHNDSGERERHSTVDYQPLKQSLEDRLIAWEHRLKVSESIGAECINIDDPSVILLKIEHKAAFIYLSKCEIEESSFDTYQPNFVQILNLCRAFNEKQPQNDLAFTALFSRAFSLNSGCVPALFLTAFKCRDPVLRREAITILETQPRREGLWDAALHAKIGRRIVELEEASMLRFEGAEYAAMEEAPSTQMITSNGAAMSKWPLERFRIRNISRVSEDPARSARVTFFTAPYGLDEQIVIWDEDFEF